MDTHDAGAFPAAAWRTRTLRVLLGGAALLLVLVSAASARDLETRERGLIPSGTTGVVVVDLSLSIADEDYRAVRAAFRRLVTENASIGLVVFSDVAYELLPPGTPASELRPMLRLLIPPRLGPPVNPWTQSFRAGTKVSSALELARRMLERDQVRSGSILLVSDLETAPDDVPSLARTVETLRRGSIQLKVLGLAPSPDAQLIFAGLLQEDAFEAPPAGAGGEEAVSETRVKAPRTLLLLGAIFFVALAAHERFAGRLAITSERSPA
ncbi:MAG: VWA domain-containing protein [Actinomycetota bacterium]|nr:VWA domain-containing protein [Actinomycetota bacterium]